MSNAPRILICDDHVLMREALRGICESLGGFSVVGQAANGAQAVEMARTMRPDVTLMDLDMPDMDGVEAIRRIMRQDPASRVIAVTMYFEDPHILEAIRAGARDYLVKTVAPEILIAAIRAVSNGDYLIGYGVAPPPAEVKPVEVVGKPAAVGRPQQDVLTPREMAILRMVAQGADNHRIAKALHASPHTVANRLRTVFEKLSVTNRTQAVLHALRQGWVTMDQPAA